MGGERDSDKGFFVEFFSFIIDIIFTMLAQESPKTTSEKGKLTFWVMYKFAVSKFFNEPISSLAATRTQAC